MKTPKYLHPQQALNNKRRAQGECIQSGQFLSKDSDLPVKLEYSYEEYNREYVKEYLYFYQGQMINEDLYNRIMKLKAFS